ncbi:MAG: hypothetical protein IKJ75_06440 [Clostridia bacterium]|nr:hypothetical protein [Clostridia bacterium]
MTFFSNSSAITKCAAKLSDELSNIDFDPSRAVKMLKHMGVGMLVIFVIIGIIILSTVVIQKLFSEKKDK